MLTSTLTAKKYTVTTTNDSGKGSLREAISCANAAQCPSIIAFDISERDGGYDKSSQSWRITPHTELPEIIVPLQINGFTQRGSCPNRHAIDQENSAIINIEILGPLGEARNNRDARVGLTFGKGSDHSRIKGIAINGFQKGIRIDSCAVSITGAFLGVGLNGTTAVPNIVSLLVDKNAAHTQIGGCKPKHRNLFAGTGCFSLGDDSEQKAFGTVTIFGSDTAIQGTTINLTRKGNSLILHDAVLGIVSSNTSGTLIGGTTATARVIISGHSNANILCDTTHNDTISHVFAGTSLDGKHALGGGCGIKIVGDQADGPDAEKKQGNAYNHTIKHCLFSGNRISGIILGQLDGAQLANKTYIFNTKAGTDSAGIGPVPNEQYGLSIDYATNTRVEESTFRYNTLNGIHQVRAGNSLVEKCDVSFNGLGGIKVEPIAGTKGERPESQYEVKLGGVTAQGNGDNGVATPCGFIKEL